MRTVIRNGLWRYALTIPKELIDQFINGPINAEAIQDASMAFKKALIERALGVLLSGQGAP